MAITTAAPDRLEWQALPRTAQLYVVAVIAAGVCAVVAFFPREWPPAVLFTALVLASCLTSIWKVNLPIPLASGSTLSVSYAADLTALLLLGPASALLVALAGAWTQCTFNVKRSYPLVPHGVQRRGRSDHDGGRPASAYTALGGAHRAGRLRRASPSRWSARLPTYFVVNTGLVAGAIALSTRQSLFEDLARGFPLERRQLHRRRQRRRGRGGRHRARPALDGLPDDDAGLPGLPHLLDLRRPARRRAAPRRGNSSGCTVTRWRLCCRRARSEQALADENERLGVMLRSIGDGVIASDLDGTILLINNVAEALTGWHRDEALGQPLAIRLSERRSRHAEALCDHPPRAGRAVRRRPALAARPCWSRAT